MRQAHQGSVSRRVAISVVAAYGLLLQAYLGMAAPADWFFSEDGISCSPGRNSPDPPSGEHPRHDCVCCTVTCAVGGCGTPAASIPTELLLRQGEAVAWARSHRSMAEPPARFQFAARGPPRAV